MPGLDDFISPHLKTKPTVHVKRKDIKHIKGRTRTMIYSLSKIAHEEHDPYYKRHKKFRDSTKDVRIDDEEKAKWADKVREY